MSDVDENLESGPSSESHLNQTTISDTPPSSAIITPDSVANVSTALLMAVAVSTVSVTADALMYIAYCSIEKESLSLQELKAFAYFPAIGAVVVGVVAWLAFIYLGMAAHLTDENGSFRINCILWLTLVAGLVADTALGFLLNDSMVNNPRSHSKSTDWLVSIGLNLIVAAGLGLALACGGGMYIIAALCSAHEFIRECLEPIIGPGTSFAEGHYPECLTDCGSIFWARRDSRVSDSSQLAPLLAKA